MTGVGVGLYVPKIFLCTGSPSLLPWYIGDEKN